MVKRGGADAVIARLPVDARTGIHRAALDDPNRGGLEIVGHKRRHLSAETPLPPDGFEVPADHREARIHEVDCNEGGRRLGQFGNGKSERLEAAIRGYAPVQPAACGTEPGAPLRVGEASAWLVALDGS